MKINSSMEISDQCSVMAKKPMLSNSKLLGKERRIKDTVMPLPCSSKIASCQLPPLFLHCKKGYRRIEKHMDKVNSEDKRYRKALYENN